jgi:hypothetical protein
MLQQIVLDRYAIPKLGISRHRGKDGWPKLAPFFGLTCVYFWWSYGLSLIFFACHPEERSDEGPLHFGNSERSAAQ